MMDLALLGAEIANGMYKRPIDAIVKPSWKRGGLLPAAAIETMIPAQSSVQVQ
jgi:hypothetical protein